MNYDQEIRLGVVGAGRIAPHHIRAAIANGFIMDSICARDNSLNAKALGKEYGFIKTFNTFAEFMMRDVDAYLVVTDTNSQIPISRKLLAMDKPILVEKPGSINVQEIDSLKKEDKNERIVMAYNRRSMSSTRTLRSLLNEISTKSFILNVPELSTKPNPNKEEISYMILENAVHAFDLLFYLFGRPSTWTISKLDIDYLMFHRIINLNYSPSRTGIINLTIGTPDNWALTVYSRGSRYVLSPLEVFTHYDEMDSTPATTERPNRLYFPKASKSWAPDSSDIKFKSGFYQQMFDYRNFVMSNKRPENLASLDDAHFVMKFARTLLD